MRICGLGAVAALSFPMRRVASSNLAVRTYIIFDFDWYGIMQSAQLIFAKRKINFKTLPSITSNVGEAVNAQTHTILDLLH